MKILFVLTLLISSSLLWGQSNSLTQEEKESEVLDYTNIQSVLKNDGLIKEKKKKEIILKAIKKEKKKIQIERYNYPSEDDFWPFVSEYWLVKKAQLLRWDFPKPEYGIDVAFRNLLENFGFYNRTYKILIVNSPEVTHMALPAGKNKFILILSLPFMRSLDLTKVDISLLLFEDMLRAENGYFIQNLEGKVEVLGKNFYGQKLDMKFLKDLMQNYDKVIFKKGFNFQQQFEVTKQMDSYLKSDPALWSTYFNLLKKLDRFIKTDSLYKDYLKIYPSPELQLEWISPQKKVI